MIKHDPRRQELRNLEEPQEDEGDENDGQDRLDHGLAAAHLQSPLAMSLISSDCSPYAPAFSPVSASPAPLAFL